MGKKLTGSDITNGGEDNNHKSTTPTDSNTGGSGGVSGGSNTGDSSGAGETGGSSTKGESTQGSPKVVTIDLPEGSKKTPPKSNAERQKEYRERKKAGNTTKKTGNTSKDLFNDDSLVNLIVTVSTVFAMRPNMQHWAISGDEAREIVTPLNKVLAKSNKKFISDNADYIALFVACATILMPRVMVSVSMIKTKKESEKIERTIARSNQPTNKGNVKTQSNGDDAYQALCNAIPQ